MVLCAGSFFVMSVEQNDFLGDKRVVGQSSAEACSQVSCSPGDWPDDMVQKLGGINQHHVWSTWSRDRDTERLDEHGLVSLPQTAVLIDQGRMDWTHHWTSAMSMQRCCPMTNSRLNRHRRWPSLDSDCLLEQLHCFDLLLYCLMEFTA